MSMQLYILSDQQMGSIDAWQKEIDAGGFAVKLSAATPLAKLQGALPARCGDRQTSFECGHCNADALIAKYRHLDFGRSWKYALAMRWNADLHACLAAYMAAAAYARATGGVVLDCEDSKINSPQRAIEVARDLERRLPETEALLQEVAGRYRQ